MFEPMSSAEAGRRGGLARAANMTKKQLSEGGRRAALAMWQKRRKRESEKNTTATPR